MATLDTATRTIPAGAIGAEQNLATWAGPYVTDMLGKAQALAGTEFQPYTGTLTAGPSALQTQAFQGLGSLTIPKNITEAGTNLGQVAQKAGQMSYTPGQFASTYQAPSTFQAADFQNRFAAPDAYQGTQFTNQFVAPQQYQATQFANQFTAPQQYQASTFATDQYSQQAIQPYMNPYLQSVLDPQLREAQRQAEIARNQMQSRMAQAGAYGGSRQAIMEAEAQRNLMQQLGDITGKGYATAFDVAQQQFGAEQARRMQAEQLREQSRQFGAQQAMTANELQARYGLSAQQAQEASKQFAAQQGMTAAELQARYGLSAQQAQEASKQFGAQQAMTAADLQARYGLSADQAREASRQFAAQQAAETARTGAQYGLEAQRLGEQSRQFGAGFGLDALSRQMQALQAQGALGATESQVGLANLAAQLQGGAMQRGIEQEGLAADYAQYLRESQFPYEQLKFQQSMLAGLPIAATAYAQPEQDPMDAFLKGMKDITGLLKTFGIDDATIARLTSGGGDTSTTNTANTNTSNTANTNTSNTATTNTNNTATNNSVVDTSVANNVTTSPDVNSVTTTPVSEGGPTFTPDIGTIFSQPTVLGNAVSSPVSYTPTSGGIPDLLSYLSSAGPSYRFNELD